VLAKASGTDYDTEWVDQSGGGGGRNKNFFRNSTFLIDQIRETNDFDDGGYYIDNWFFYSDVGNQNSAFKTYADAPDETPTYARLANNTGNTRRYGIGQMFFNRDTLELAQFGNLTVSGRARASTALTIRIAIVEYDCPTPDSFGFSSNIRDPVLNWNSTNYVVNDFFKADTELYIQTVSDSLNIGTGWTDFDWTFSGLQSTTTNVLVFIWLDTTTAAGVTCDFCKMKFEEGSTPTAYEWPRWEDDYMVAQQQYRKSFRYPIEAASGVGINSGEEQWPSPGTSLAHRHFVPFNPPMACNPRVTLYNPASSGAQARNINDNADCTSTSLQNQTHRGFSVQTTSTAGSAAGETLAIHWDAYGVIGIDTPTNGITNP